MILLLLFHTFLSVLSYGWFPLLDLKSYNIKKPSEIQIFDKKLVVWEKDNNIVVQDNACLHRGGPLSEGFIDNQSRNLKCSYHGWEFDQNGNIISLPQSNKKPDFCKFQKTYQTFQSCNILWILYDDRDTPFPTHISKHNNSVSDDTFVIEVPYSINTLLENFFDPAHIPFAHHKLQSTRDAASPVNSTLITMDPSCLQIYFEDSTLPNKKYRNGTMSFYYPSHYLLNSTYPDIYIKRLHVYCVPVYPFKTRIFVQNEYNHKNNFRNALIINTIQSLPKWIKHPITHTFFDSDTMLLHKQEQMLKNKNSFFNSTKTYFTPSSSDYSIYLFHKWKNKFAPNWTSISYSSPLDLHLSRKQIFDRYHDHTIHCVSCSSALHSLQTIQTYAPPLLLSQSMYFQNYFLALSAVFLYLIIDKIKSIYIFQDYIHNEL